VQGLWHLGTVTAACLASIGHEVVGLDSGADAITALNRGAPPVLEPGLQDLVKQGLATGRLVFSTDAASAVRDIDILWIAYDTPVDDDDNANVDFVIAEIERTLAYLADNVTVLISSQMPVGSIKRLETIAAHRFSGKGLSFACLPENLRLGSALRAFLAPDRIVAGIRTARDRERIDHLLRPITDRIEWMSVESAEMTKHAINAFLAVSVTFANEIASICERVGADAKEVERGLKSEARIGPKAYLSPGAAFAGGTLARDVAFLSSTSAERGLFTPLVSSIKRSNDEHRGWTQRKLQTLFPKLSGLSIAIWGLTYKPGTDTLRRSMAVELCDWLVERGARVRVHDPAVTTLPEAWRGKIGRSNDPLDALKGARAVVLSTEWPQYREVNADELVAVAPGLCVLDANRYLAHLAGDSRVRYIAVGVPDRNRD
jgi:UDPglucose 6-dehydrogenase